MDIVFFQRSQIFEGMSAEEIKSALDYLNVLDIGRTQKVSLKQSCLLMDLKELGNSAFLGCSYISQKTYKYFSDDIKYMK